jgi:hypothetical protein
MFPQRAFPVYRCGWRGLHTAAAVARISASYPPTIDSVPQRLEELACQPPRPSSSILCADFDHAAIHAQFLSQDDY